jgi:release factor glutamine methyltransferase
VAAGREKLRQAGISEPEAALDARLLAQWLLGWDAARFFASADEEPRPTFQPNYDQFIERRANREPMAYIHAGQEFYGRMFEVTPAVLIPRPETEIIVEAALSVLPNQAKARVADIGTGSGCLAITIACERPLARILATDISPDALEIALRNARRHEVDARVSLAAGDLLPPPVAGDPVFDLIVSNPPYVPEGDQPSLAPEVRDYEPAGALFAGQDGLDVIRRLIPVSAGRLAPGGYLIFEIGIDQDAAVTQLISTTPDLRIVGLRNDLQGIPRTVVVQRT